MVDRNDSNTNTSSIIAKQSNLIDKSNIKQEVLNKTIKFCDRCGHQFTPKDVHILFVQTNIVGALFECPKCKAQNMVTVGIHNNMAQAQKIHLYADITHKELGEFLRRGQISYKDVVKGAKLLTKANVRVRDLF